MAGWHHRLDGHESEWTPGVGDGQGGLACCGSWGHKQSDTTELLNWIELIASKDKENHSKSFTLFLNWLLILLQMSSTLKSTVLAKKLIVYNRFIFSGHISLTAAIKHNLINSPSVNSFLCLANEWVAQKLILVAASFSTFYEVTL